MTPLLLVDDKEENLYYLQTLLTAHGYQVETARNGEEALHKARKNLPGLVISDLLMPVLDGYTFLRMWKVDERLNSIPFIVYTATYTDPEDENLAFKFGADAFILKPCEPDEFITRIRKVLEKAGTRKPGVPPEQDETEKHHLLQEYSEILIRKLEQKTLQLEQTNRELQRELEERKRTEEALVKSDERFRNLLQVVTSVAVQSYSMDGTTLYWNRASELFYGYTAEEAVGQNLLDLIIPDEMKQVVRESIAVMVETGEAIPPGELNLQRKEGSSITVYSSHAIVNIPGREPEFFCMDIDLTERKQADAQIREQAALLDAANEAIYVQDLHDHTLLFWNKGAERIYGWSIEEALGKSAIELIYKNRTGYEESLDKLKREGEWQGEFIHLSKEETPIIIESNWTLLKDESGNPKSILTINSDITEKKDLENQFLRAQRMESIGTLAGGIAHDLNNMLAPILMAIELLTEFVKDPRGLSLLNSMEDSAVRGADLIKQVLSFARGVEGERIVVNPVHIMRELVTVLRETFPKSITITFTADPDSWLITGDPTQLHQVLLNMCVNARDAMPGGGELRIRMQNKMLDESITATNINARAGSYVLFSVSDTGTGMSQIVLDKIFEPFFTTKSFGKGTGLGLSTTLAIVRSHKGFIDVHSEEGKGTTFDIYFPAEPNDRRCHEKISAPPLLPQGNGEWVLAVEDEEAIRKVVKHTLERFGYHVLLAENGKEAIRMYTEHKEKIAVILTDMAMPVMDGPKAIQAIKKINPDAMVIMSSGLTASTDINEEISENVTAFIPKPYAAEVLLQTLHRVLHPEETDPKSASHPS